MTAAPVPRSLVLGVYPNVRGFGWIAFEGPFAVYDWGLVFVQNDKNRRCLAHFERLLARLEPEALILEAFPETTRRTARIVTLQRAMSASAFSRGVEATMYPRGDVQAMFAPVGARSRQDIAVAVARQVPALSHRLPRKRGAWHCEDRRMALFNAAALVITHFQLDANRLLRELDTP